jgi:hypothetical protein
MLYFGDRVAVLNDFIYQTGGSILLFLYLLFTPSVPKINAILEF